MFSRDQTAFFPFIFCGVPTTIRDGKQQFGYVRLDFL